MAINAKFYESLNQAFLFKKVNRKIKHEKVEVEVPIIFRNLSATFEGTLEDVKAELRKYLDPNHVLDAENNKYSGDHDIEVLVGCDSHYHGTETKFSIVIVIHWKGHGGICFYTNIYKPKNETRIMRDRLWMEVMYSVQLAQLIDSTVAEFNVPLEVHLDVNSKKGEGSNIVMNEVVGYVQGNGFKHEIKPNAAAATYCADRLAR